MRTRREVVQACLQFPDAYEDYPFDDSNWTAIRHRGNHKIFALIFERNGKIWINVKAEPMHAIFWRDAYPSVLPGYHMNNRHWISIILDGKMEGEDVLSLIADSYALTQSKRKKASDSQEKADLSHT